MYGHVAIKMTRHQPIRPHSLYEVVPHSRDKNEYLFYGELTGGEMTSFHSYPKTNLWKN